FYLSGGADTITGTAGDDTVYGYRSHIGTNDTMSMGEGADTLVFHSMFDAFDTKLYDGYDGLDVLDVSEVSFMELTLDDGFLSRTDDGVLTIAYGEKGIAMLDTSAVDSSLYQVQLEGGGGEVHLWHGNDTLFGSDGIDVIFGNGGDDVLQGNGGADRLIGGKIGRAHV